jgi:hypothetical protein
MDKKKFEGKRRLMAKAPHEKAKRQRIRAEKKKKRREKRDKAGGKKHGR